MTSSRETCRMPLLNAIPRAQLVTYAGTGHSPHWEDPSRFAADLVRFLERFT